MCAYYMHETQITQRHYCRECLQYNEGKDVDAKRNHAQNYVTNLALSALSVYLNDYGAAKHYGFAFNNKYLKAFDKKTVERIRHALTSGDCEGTVHPFGQSNWGTIETTDPNGHNWGVAKEAFIALRTSNAYGGCSVGLAGFEVRGGVGTILPADAMRVLSDGKTLKNFYPIRRFPIASFLMSLIKILGDLRVGKEAWKSPSRASYLRHYKSIRHPRYSTLRKTCSII